MGMKIKQESRVRTFLKRIFRFSRKDKAWKHMRLEQNVEYAESSFSLNNLLKSHSRESIDSNVKKSDTNYPGYACNKENDSLGGCNKGIEHENIQNNKKKNKKWQVKVNLNKTRLVEVTKYETIDEPCMGSESSVNGKAQNKKNNKSKHHRSSSLETKERSRSCNSEGDDLELVDIDLDLVLSSFANVRKAGREAEDNHANEQRIRQGSISSDSAHQVEAVVDKPDMDTVDCPQHDWNETYPETINLVHSSNTKNAQEKANNDEKENSVTAQQERSKPKKSEKKKSRKRRNRKRAYQSIEEDTCQSTELIHESVVYEPPSQCTGDNTEPPSQCTGDNTEPPSQCTGDNTDETQITEQHKKKSRKNKKRKNVRSPEDDFEFVTSPDLPRRRKHQDLYASDVIADLGTPAESVEQVPSGNKKLRRRKLKLKFNKGQKKFDVKQYDELRDQLTGEAERSRDTERRNNAREVGRRMWKACKAGFRYMKAGLVYYTKAPVNVTNFSPILRRYEDGFDEFDQPGTSYRAGY